MTDVEPIPGAPAATAALHGERALVIADYHAGIEWALAVERGVEVESRAEDRRETLLDLVARTGADRLVVLGDLMHSIGDPGGSEREEVEALVDALGELPVTLVKGNHDGKIEEWVPEVEVVPGSGVRLGDLGFAHGHTWPDPDVLGADVLCVGHEHPQVRLEDAVGGSRVERVWLRGAMDMAPFARRDPDLPWLEADLPPADVGTDAADGLEPAGADVPESDDAAESIPDDAAGSVPDDAAGSVPNDAAGSVTNDAAGSVPDDAADDGRTHGADSGEDWHDPELVVFPAFNELVGGTWINVEGQEFLAPFLPRALSGGEAFLLDGTRLGSYETL